MILKWFGFILLVFFSILLLNPFKVFSDFLTLLLLSLICFFYLIGLLTMGLKIGKTKSPLIINFESLIMLGFVMLGVLFTYFLSFLFDVNAVIGSAMVGLLAHIFLKKYAVEIYCGSFAGMIGIFLFSPLEALLVAVVTGLFFIITRPICNGIGGKLGAIAFVSVGMVAFILQKTFDVFIAYPEFGYELIMLIAMLGAILTYLIQHKLKQTPVFSSSGISLIVGLILGYTSSHGFIFAAAFFAGTFVGMASKEVIPNVYLIAIAGIILGFIYHMTLSDYVGSGGKLGMMAFISVTTTFGIKSLFHYFIENKKHLV